MLENVLNTIEKYNMLSAGDRVVVGVSGGPDSIALLHVLYTIKDRYNLYIHAAHLNHMLRGEEADRDTKYVEDFCRKLNIPCTVKYVDINELSQKEGFSHEEAGRKARYELFLETAKKNGAGKIALAHNMNDQAETVLMRIMRGTGLDGLCGIKPVRDGLFIRPFLFTLRDDIEKYCEDNNLMPRIDSTNLEPVYHRNRIRLELIPYIKKDYSHNIETLLSTMAELLREDNEFINEYVESVYNELANEKQGGVSIDIMALKNLNNGVKKRIIRKAIDRVKGDLNGIESKHVELIISITDNGTTGAAVELPGNVKARISYNLLNIMMPTGETNVKFNYPMYIPGTTMIYETGDILNTEVLEAGSTDYLDNKKFVKYFDYGKIKYNLNLRTRQEGDFIVPIGMKGRKKLKELFIDNKIPREQRDNIPLVATGNEIIWVIGHKISEHYKITGDTKKILKIEYMQPGGIINAE